MYSFHEQPQVYRETLVHATYFAPRGRARLYMLAGQLSQRYLYPSDLLIGIIGTEGSGKSTLIKGLFPGLELTNDDDGVNLRPAPIYNFSPEDYFSGHTFHLDIRYELAFKQRCEIVQAINEVISHKRRVVVEHFDLIYKDLGYNAQVLIGIGEEVIVARPTFFGPFPGAMKSVIDKTIAFRRMAHSAEDITSLILLKDYNYKRNILHSDVKHGFVINFPDRPDIDLTELEAKVHAVISSDIPIHPAGEDRIRIGKDDMYCTGTRTHVSSSGQIEHFALLKDFVYQPITDEYMLVGTVGERKVVDFDELAATPDSWSIGGGPAEKGE